MTIRRAIRASALALAALLGLAGCRKLPPTGVALVGVTVFDGTGAPPKRDMVVVARNDVIEAIVPRDGFKLPARTLEVDAAGQFVLPGLIDSHVHAAPWTLPRFLAYGVTAVRDVHGPLDSVLALREHAALGTLRAPRIYAAGAMIDAAPATYPDALAAADANAARKAVDRLAVAGVDYVKVYTRVAPPMMRAILDEAQTFGLRVTAHLGLTDAVTAGDLGVKAIEHLSGVPEATLGDAAPIFAAHRSGFFPGWTAFERAWPGLDSAGMARVAQHLVNERVTMVPTLVLHETFSHLDDPSALQDPDLAAVPDSEMTKWNVPGMIQRAGWGPSDFAAFKAARANQDLFVRIYRALGGRVVAGTDAANQLLVPGASLHRELELLVGAGFSPADAILSATRDAAQLLGADSIGTLAPGKKADLVVLRENPLTDIRKTREISWVMARGLLMPADSLRKRW